MSKGKFIFIFTVFVTFFSIEVLAQDSNVFNYTGALGCKKCHKSAKSGAQYTVWQDNQHSKAFTTLASGEAAKIAKEKGIADRQKAKECLKCHVTAYDMPAERLEAKYAAEEGVSCESCHGPGSAYSKKRLKML